MESVSIPEKFGLELSQIGMQVFSFLVLTVILWKFGFKPVLATLDERQETIASGLQYAEEMKVKLADAETHHKEVLQKASIEAQGIVEDARKIADEKISKATQEAVKQAEEVIKKSEKQIEMDRKQMLEEARSEIARLVVATAAKVLSKDLTADEKSRYSESASSNLVDSSN
tara:strand:- start:740 stop:1255 length:516 start_codon:yes stop_codon:yes gene_type:complete